MSMPLIRASITSTRGLACVTYTNERIKIGDACKAIYYDPQDMPIDMSVTIATINEVEIIL